MIILKSFRKDKEGLKGIFKVIGQVILGIVVGSTSIFPFRSYGAFRTDQYSCRAGDRTIRRRDDKSTLTTIPFLKNNEFDYADLIDWIPNSAPYSWLVFIPFVVFIVTAFSNGANSDRWN